MRSKVGLTERNRERGCACATPVRESPQEQLPHIFERFRRVEGARTDPRGHRHRSCTCSRTCEAARGQHPGRERGRPGRRFLALRYHFWQVAASRSIASADPARRQRPARRPVPVSRRGGRGGLSDGGGRRLRRCFGDSNHPAYDPRITAIAPRPRVVVTDDNAEVCGDYVRQLCAPLALEVDAVSRRPGGDGRRPGRAGNFWFLPM